MGYNTDKMFHFVSEGEVLTPKLEADITAASAWVQIVPTHAIKPWQNAGALVSESMSELRLDIDGIMVQLDEERTARARLEKKVYREANKTESQILSLANHISEIKNLMREKDKLKKDLVKMDNAHSLLYYCNVCTERPKAMRLSPCGHMATCPECTDEIMEQNGLCPLCRTAVTKADRTFI